MTYSLVDSSVAKIVRPLIGYHVRGKLLGRPDIVVTLGLQGGYRQLVFSEYITVHWDNPTRHNLSAGSRVKVAVHDESGRIAGIIYGDLGFIPDYVFPDYLLIP